MIGKYISRICGFIVLVAAAIGLWAHFQNEKANSCIDEANALLNKGNAIVLEVAPKYQGLLKDDVLTNFPGNRADLEATAQESADKYKQAAEYYRSAAAKLDEGVETSASEIVSQYWELLAKADRKLAENKEAARTVALLFVDKSVQSLDQLNDKLTPLADIIEKSNQAYDDFSAQADKIKADHPNDIK